MYVVLVQQLLWIPCLVLENLECGRWPIWIRRGDLFIQAAPWVWAFEERSGMPGESWGSPVSSGRRSAKKIVGAEIKLIFDVAEYRHASNSRAVTKGYLLQRFSSEWNEYVDVIDAIEIDTKDKLRAVPIQTTSYTKVVLLTLWLLDLSMQAKSYCLCFLGFCCLLRLTLLSRLS